MASEALTNLLAEVDTLPPSKRNEKLVATALSLSKGDLTTLRQELDAKLAASEILPRDYALLLNASSSVPWALNLLKTSLYPVVITTSLGILTKTWRKDPSSMTAAFGNDSQNLVELIDTLPQYATVRLFRSFGTSPHLTESHYSVVDNILKAIFPFLSASSPTPLKRYARSATTVLFQAASPALLTAVIEKCSTWFSEGTWKHLAERRPEIGAEILLRQVDPDEAHPELTAHLVSNKDWNEVMLAAVLTQLKDDVFFKKFLSRYVSWVLKDQSRPDILGASPREREAALVPHMAFILNKRTSKHDLFRTALDLCQKMKELVDGGASDEWTWFTMRPLLDIACHELGNTPEQWTLMSAKDTLDQAGKHTPLGLILAIFAKIEYSRETFASPGRDLIRHLLRLPKPARLPLLNIWYIAKTNESLLDPPIIKANYPAFSAYLLSLLSPEHGRRITEVGGKALVNQFIATEYNYGWSSSSQNNLWSLLDPQAPAAFVSAMWAGSENSPLLGDRATQHGEVNKDAIRDIGEYKKLAARSRDDRYGLVTKALSLSILSQSPSLFTETLSWAVERFAKDPQTSPLLLSWITTENPYIQGFLCGPPSLYASDRTRGRLTKDRLDAWCSKTNEVFDSLFHLLGVWAHEPSFVASLESYHRSIGDALMQVIEGRTELIDKIYPTLLDDIDGLRAVLLDPLIGYWIRWERIKVQEHSDLLQYNSEKPTPCMISTTLDLHKRILPAIFPFLDQLSKEREALYREARTRLPQQDLGEIETWRMRQSGTRYITPFTFEIEQTKSTNSCKGIHLPSTLRAYNEAVVLGNPETKRDNQLADPLDCHPTQFSEALEAYVTFSKDWTEIDQKVLDLLNRYGPSQSRPDFRSILLRSPTIQRALWSREALNPQVVSWLPVYPTKNHDEAIEFDPLLHMPPGFTFKDYPDHLLSWRTPDDDFAMLKAFTETITDAHVKKLTRGASRNTIHRLSVLAVAWILSVLKVPTAPDAMDSDGPVNYAIRKVRLSQAFLDKCSRSETGGWDELRRAKYSCRILKLVLPYLLLSEIQTLLTTVFSVPKTPISEAVSMTVMGYVRRVGIPQLVIGQAFLVLEDVEASSWHRQTITPGVVNRSRPRDAQDLVHKLLTDTQRLHKEQKARPKPAPAEGGANTQPTGALLKMSTHKMVMQLLETVLRQGSLDEFFVKRSADTGLLDTPEALASHVVDILVETVQSHYVLSRENEPEQEAWAVLEPFVAIAQRLSEDQEIDEENWEAARLSKIPMPTIKEQRYIASSLISRDILSMPPSLRRAWAERVVQPIILGHVATRTKWLKTAVVREGSTSIAPSTDLAASISASFGSGILVVNSFNTFAPYLPPDTKLVNIMEQGALAFLARKPCVELRDLMGANHGSGWASTPYGKTVSELTQYAISDTLTTGSSELSALSTVLKTADIPASLSESVYASLRHIGTTLLEPKNMDVHANQRAIVPFGAFNYFATSHLALRDLLEPKIISLVKEFLAIAENYEQDLSKKNVNGGACYWRSILILKLLSLRSNENTPNNRSEGWIQDRANNLAKIVSQVAEKRWYQAHYPHTFTSHFKFPRVDEVIPVCLALTNAPLCPSQSGWDRFLFFETAVALLRAHKSSIVGNPAAEEQLRSLQDIWSNDADFAVGWLSLSWHDTDV